MANTTKSYDIKKKVITISIPGSLYDYLRTKENYSEYICNLIENDKITLEDLDDIDFDKEEARAVINKVLDRLF